MAGAHDTGVRPTDEITPQAITQPNGTVRGESVTLAELMHQLSEQSTRLVHQEIELAKAELTAKGKRAGLGAGMFGGAGVFGVYALGALTAAGILALSLAVAAWLAALIVAVVLVAAGGTLALIGKSEVQQATPPVPEQAAESVKEDVQWAKTRAQEARR
jgi:hypothetical protein